LEHGGIVGLELRILGSVPVQGGEVSTILRGEIER
jgi:hypothetical protein